MPVDPRTPTSDTDQRQAQQIADLERRVAALERMVAQIQRSA